MKRTVRRAAQWIALVVLATCGVLAMIVLLSEPAEGVDVLWNIVWTKTVAVVVLYGVYKAAKWCFGHGLIPESICRELTEEEEDAL